MARIGVYDLDWHYGFYKKKIFNLDLMKVFNYYWKKGDIVNFISPQDSDLNRYSAIYYFKDNPNLKLPNKIKITSNSYLRGYGFYNCYKSLRQDVLDTPPTFMPYEFLELPKTMEYLSNSIKKNSYIRLETEDYSFYKPDSKIIYIADYNAFRLDNLSNLLNDKDIKYYFVWPIICDSEECYESYKELTKKSNRRLQINFTFDYDFIINNKGYNNIYPIYQREETKEQDLFNIVNAAISYKKEGLPLFLMTGDSDNRNFYNQLVVWARYTKPISFYDFCSADEKKIKIYNAATLNNLELNKLLRTKI